MGLPEVLEAEARRRDRGVPQRVHAIGLKPDGDACQSGDAQSARVID
jgi:hypothetical protein